MRKGSLPRSIAVPAGSFGPCHAPDGLDEAAVDELIEESYMVQPSRRPGWLSSDVVEVRRSRRKARQAVRSLPAALSPVAPVQGEAA